MAKQGGWGDSLTAERHMCGWRRCWRRARWAASCPHRRQQQQQQLAALRQQHQAAALAGLLAWIWLGPHPVLAVALELREVPRWENR